MVKISCDNCSGKFNKKPSHVLRYKNNFCCKECRSAWQITSIELKCYCGNKFSRQQCHIGKNNFCSKSCAAKHTNKNKVSGYRRSKLEKWIEKVISDRYPTLGIRFNDRSLCGFEFDIYVESLSLAIELNGIIHYKPIYGLDRLNLIQDRDRLKKVFCEEHNIQLLILDVSLQKKFTEESSLSYLSAITSAISQRLSVSK